jgi:hypothetical protein
VLHATRTVRLRLILLRVLLCYRFSISNYNFWIFCCDSDNKPLALNSLCSAFTTVGQKNPRKKGKMKNHHRRPDRWSLLVKSIMEHKKVQCGWRADQRSSIIFEIPDKARCLIFSANLAKSVFYKYLSVRPHALIYWKWTPEYVISRQQMLNNSLANFFQY